MKLFRNLLFIIFLLFSFTIFAFNPGKDSQFIGSKIVDFPIGKDSLKIDHPDKAIILIYNQGWGISNTKSKYVRGKDPCFVNFYLDNQKKYIPGLLGPWYSLASEFNEIIKDKKKLENIRENMKKNHNYNVYSNIENVKIKSSSLNSDIHASADYRAHLIKVMAKKAVASCK